MERLDRDRHAGSAGNRRQLVPRAVRRTAAHDLRRDRAGGLRRPRRHLPLRRRGRELVAPRRALQQPLQRLSDGRDQPHAHARHSDRRHDRARRRARLHDRVRRLTAAHAHPHADDQSGARARGRIDARRPDRRRRDGHRHEALALRPVAGERQHPSLAAPEQSEHRLLRQRLPVQECQRRRRLRQRHRRSARRPALVRVRSGHARSRRLGGERRRRVAFGRCRRDVAAKNRGLATLECYTVSSHPIYDAVILTGPRGQRRQPRDRRRGVAPGVRLGHPRDGDQSREPAAHVPSTPEPERRHALRQRWRTRLVDRHHTCARRLAQFGNPIADRIPRRRT